MPFQISPGVNVSEIDLTNIIPAVSTTEGGIAGVFQWGPVNTPTLVSSEVDMRNRFGYPKTGYNVETFYTAADFLSYGNALYVVRVSDGNTATSNTTPDTVFEAKYPGALGNDLEVHVIDNAAFDTANTVHSIFDAAPTAPDLHIAIVDTVGRFSRSGGANTIIERFDNVSITPGDKNDDGTNNYFLDVINDRSKYVNMPVNTTAFNSGVYVLENGTDGSEESNTAIYSSLTTGYDMLADADNIDISLVLQGKAIGAANDWELGKYILDNVCDVRRDCVAFISPHMSDVVGDGLDSATEIVDFRNGLGSSSYGVMDTGYKYRYDKYNDRYVYTPLNGDIAGLCVRTDDTRDPWFSPAGYNRGFIKNVIRLAYNPSSRADRDLLYKNGVNPVITEKGQGTLLFGDKTLQKNASAFDRINVRRLFIVLEKAISKAAKQMLFEFNDEFTRAQFVNLVEPYLRDVQGRRGIYDFRVVSDATNNTPEVIDRNEFVGDIYVKPARSINFIQLNFVAVRTGVEFEEVVGQF